MKAKVERPELKFQPIELTITIENENDLKWFLELFNVPKVCLIEANDAFRSLKDPDPNGELTDILTNMVVWGGKPF